MIRSSPIFLYRLRTDIGNGRVSGSYADASSVVSATSHWWKQHRSPRIASFLHQLVLSSPDSTGLTGEGGRGCGDKHGKKSKDANQNWPNTIITRGIAKTSNLFKDRAKESQTEWNRVIFREQLSPEINGGSPDMFACIKPQQLQMVTTHGIVPYTPTPPCSAWDQKCLMHEWISSVMAS